MLVTFHWYSYFIVLLIIIYLLHKYISRNYNYWKKRNIFYVKPLPFIGNFLDVFLMKHNIGEYIRNLYNETNDPFFGIFVFDQPYLILRDPELIKNILVKDFNNFYDRSVLASKSEPLAGRSIFFTKSTDWKCSRTQVTPLFTSWRVKLAIPQLKEISEAAVKYIANNSSRYSLDAKEICSKYMTDVIMKYAFGVNAHSFDNEDAEFRRLGREVFEFTWGNAVQQTSYFFSHHLAELFRMEIFNTKCLKFIKNVFWETVDFRKSNDIKGNDFVDWMMQIMKNHEDFNKYEFDRISAHAVQFFIAGFETTSAVMAFSLYEWCIAPEIQNKIRDEIKMTKMNGEMTLEAIENMTYLHMCICETMRKYPVLGFLDRRCMEDYKIPGTDTIIEKGIPVYIPVLGLHYDPQYYPNPEKYDPERFSPENIDSIPSCAYLPFGDGPRYCIGKRFGLLSAKIGLMHIISNFELVRLKETPVPIEFEPKSLVMASKVGLPMKLKKLNAQIL